MASVCTNLTGAARVVRLLKVDGHSASTTICTETKPSEGIGDDGCIKSRWNVGGYEWEIRLYPATLVFGTGYDQPLFRKRPKPWCRLVDTRGLLEPSEEKTVSHVFGVYRQIQHSSGEVVLMERHDLAASGYLRDDCLTVQCAVTVLKELPVPTVPAKQVTAPPTDLYLHFAELLQRGTGADVTFLVSGESFAAHKNILAARSRVFMAEFFGDMKEKSSRSVEIKDMEASVFKSLLHFIYTDKAPELEKEQRASTVMAQHLLAAADRYGLDRLKLICEAKLSRGVTVDTAATTLALAEQHSCSQLKTSCVKFILSSPAILEAVLATEGYKHLAASCPLVLADLLKSSHGIKIVQA